MPRRTTGRVRAARGRLPTPRRTRPADCGIPGRRRGSVSGADASGGNEDSVIGQQRHVCRSHRGDRPGRAVPAVDRPVVLVDHAQLAPAQGRALVIATGDPSEVGPDRGEPGVAVHGHHHAASLPVELEMEWNAQRNRPVALQQPPLDVDDQDVLGTELVPEQEPRVAQERPVRLTVGDVPGQMVVVALAPQGAGQKDDLLARRELGQQRVGGGGERHPGHATRVTAPPWPGAAIGRAGRHSRGSSSSGPRPGDDPSTAR